jgi:hypothetical protein
VPEESVTIRRLRKGPARTPDFQLRRAAPHRGASTPGHATRFAPQSAGNEIPPPNPPATKNPCHLLTGVFLTFRSIGRRLFSAAAIFCQSLCRTCRGLLPGHSLSAASMRIFSLSRCISGTRSCSWCSSLNEIIRTTSFYQIRRNQARGMNRKVSVV